MISHKQRRHILKLAKLHKGQELSKNHRNKIGLGNTNYNFSKKLLLQEYNVEKKTISKTYL